MLKSITEQIELDLRDQLEGGVDVSRWTLTSLSEHYGVSTRPVRNAIARLEAMGLIGPGPGGRWEVKSGMRRGKMRKGKGLESSVEMDPEWRRTVGDQLTAELVRRSLRGDTGYIREEATAREFGTGRAVVRAHFHELHGRGLLEKYPRRGWRVVPFRGTDLQAFQKVRQSLEDLALVEAWPYLESWEINRMLENNTTESDKAKPTPDNTLHMYFVSKAGNRYIEQFFNLNSPYYTLFFEWESEDADAARRACLEHTAILKAIITGNKAAARRALRMHLAAAHSVLVG